MNTTHPVLNTVRGKGVSVAGGLGIAGRLPNPALFERRRDTS